MENKKNVYFAYQKDGRLSNCKLLLKKGEIDYLQITKEDPNIILKYFEKKIILKKGNTENEAIKTKNGVVVELIKNHKILYEKVGKYFSPKLSIPLSLLLEMEITENNKNILVVSKNNTIEIIKENDKLSLSKKEIKNDKLSLLKKEEKMGEIVTIKVNKGGVGKTFVSLQLGSYLALEEKKVLILTSDSQNNILDYSFKNKILFESGLKEFVAGRVGEIIKLRKNLDFIPLENSTFGSQFLMKLPFFLEEMRLKYDFILIDSIPTMKIDSVFVKHSNKIIIPVFCDEVTVNGSINVIKEAGVEKILAVLINKYSNKKIQNNFLSKLKEAIEGTDIIFPEPIKNLSEIEELLDKGKTIWETNSKKIENTKLSIKMIGDKLLRKEEKKYNFDF